MQQAAVLIFLPILVFILCSQVEIAFGLRIRRKQNVLPLLFHTNGEPWPENIRNALKPMVSTLPSTFYRKTLCRKGNFSCPKLPEVEDINRIFDNQSLCPDLNPNATFVLSRITSSRSSSSVSPWVFSINYDRHRYPSEIWEANCACNSSCNIMVGNMDYQHQPVKTKMIVGIRSPEDGKAHFAVQEFSVGCTCAVQ